MASVLRREPPACRGLGERLHAFGHPFDRLLEAFEVEAFAGGRRGHIANHAAGGDILRPLDALRGEVARLLLELRRCAVRTPDLPPWCRAAARPPRAERQPDAAHQQRIAIHRLEDRVARLAARRDDLLPRVRRGCSTAPARTASPISPAEAVTRLAVSASV